MIRSQVNRQREGAVMVEAALVYPVLFMLVFGIIIFGLNAFRYHQVAHIARQAARWAMVKGEDYEKENNTVNNDHTAATPQDVYNAVILPHSGGMKPEDITYSVTWSLNDKAPVRYENWLNPTTGLIEVRPISNTVTVVVSHKWDTGLFGTMTVSSTSVNTISY